MPPTTRAPRNRALVVVDLLVGFGTLFFGGVFALVAVGTLGDRRLVDACSAASGCDGGALTTAAYIGIGVVIFGFAAGLAVFAVRALLHRWAWFGPVIGLVVMIAAFYVTLFIAGQQLGASGGSS